MGPIIDLLNQVFPCFHSFSKPLLHTYKNYVMKFFFVEGANGMLLNCHMCQFPISGHKFGKKPNNEKGVLNYKRLTFEEFLIYITYWRKI